MWQRDMHLWQNIYESWVCGLPEKCMDVSKSNSIYLNSGKFEHHPGQELSICHCWKSMMVGCSGSLHHKSFLQLTNFTMCAINRSYFCDLIRKIDLRFLNGLLQPSLCLLKSTEHFNPCTWHWSTVHVSFVVTRRLFCSR